MNSIVLTICLSFHKERKFHEKILNCYGITWGELSELNVSQINAIETDYYNRYGENISIMFNFKQLHNV